MPGKYKALYEYLNNRNANTVVLTFAQIEDLLGFKLPDSARKKNRDLPKLYHLAMTPIRFEPANLFKQFVGAQDGHVLAVHWPGDLARAIKKIRQEKR